MSKTKKITPVVLEQIPTLLERGVPPLEIARMIGCTLGTLRVVCSKSKISLRQNNRAQNGAPRSREGGARDSVSPIRRTSGDHRQTITLELPNLTVTLLRQQAGGKGLSVSALAAKLLATIVQDGLYEAVLDDGRIAKRSSGEDKMRIMDATRAEVATIVEPNSRLHKRRAA